MYDQGDDTTPIMLGLTQGDGWCCRSSTVQVLTSPMKFRLVTLRCFWTDFGQTRLNGTRPPIEVMRHFKCGQVSPVWYQ